MPDDMFFSADSKSLHRGKRTTRRTDTCRPCLVWLKDASGQQFEGVVMDISPYGMLIRMLQAMPPGTEVRVQMMRDDEFRTPLAAPRDGVVVRAKLGQEGFTDHGVRIEQKPIVRPESRPVELPKRSARRPRRTKMHTIDVTQARRTGRRSGR